MPVGPGGRYGSADAAERYLTPQVKAAYPPNPDPFNWKGIAAQLEREKQNQGAAQNRVAAASTPQAAGPAAAPAAPAPTVKQLLDAYRAMNGGKLPPGTTPEMAAMIDQGIWTDWSMLSGNPQLANALLAIQSAITQLPQDFAAAKGRVSADYENLTGDILTSGKDWMKDLYGRIVDPNDPNSALVKNDPALAGYAQSMNELDETADLNQATDLAWFEKMLAGYGQDYKTLLLGLAAPGAAEDGGGGGGGGGGRGGRGGGGRGGDSDWSTPTNTATTEQTATETGTGTWVGQNPGFFQGILESAINEGGPEMEALTRRLWQESGQDPRSMTTLLAGKLNEAELKNPADIQQLAARRAWEASVPNLTKSAITQGISALGNIPGDDPLTPKVERYIAPTAQEGANAGIPFTPTPEQSAQAALADKLLEAEISPPTPYQNKAGVLGGSVLMDKPNIPAIQQGAPAARQWGGQVAKYSGGFMPSADTLERAATRATEQSQRATMEDVGFNSLLEARKGYGTGNEFPMGEWVQQGGWVPNNVTEEEVSEGQRNIDWLSRILDFIEPYNQNANFVQSREGFVTKDVDKAGYKSSTKNKSWPNVLPGSTEDLTPGIPEEAYLTNPMMNPDEFEYDEDTLEPFFDEEGYAAGPGYEVQGMKMAGNKDLSSKLAAAAASRMGGSAIDKVKSGLFGGAGAPIKARPIEVRRPQLERSPEIERSRTPSRNRPTGRKRSRNTVQADTERPPRTNRGAANFGVKRAKYKQNPRTVSVMGKSLSSVKPKKPKKYGSRTRNRAV